MKSLLSHQIWWQFERRWKVLTKVPITFNNKAETTKSQNKNSIRDGSSTALYTFCSVCTPLTAYLSSTAHTVNTSYTIWTALEQEGFYAFTYNIALWRFGLKSTKWTMWVDGLDWQYPMDTPSTAMTTRAHAVLDIEEKRNLVWSCMIKSPRSPSSPLCSHLLCTTEPHLHVLKSKKYVFAVLWVVCKKVVYQF